MSFNPVALAKAHPVATGAVVLGGAVVVFLILSAGTGGGAQSAAPGTSQLSLQQDAENFAAGQQATAANYGLQSQAQQIAGQIQLKQLDLTGAQDSIAASLQATQAQYALQLHQTDVSAAVQNNATAASLQALHDQITGQIAAASIQSQTQLGLAGINANVAITQANDFSQLEQVIAGTQAAVSINASDNSVKIAGIQAQVQQAQIKQQGSSSIFGFLGSLALAFL